MWEYYSGKVVLLTGGSGFLGTTIAYRIIQQNLGLPCICAVPWWSVVCALLHPAMEMKKEDTANERE